MTTEVILATIDGSSEREQLVVVLTYTAGGQSTLSLRQQTWGDGVGWYDQHRVDLDPQQVGPLRAALGTAKPGIKLPPPSRCSTLPFPRLVHAESA